ncbi:MAG TPA: methyltransferase domain-containing protein [Candidatus Eremiobacteraceae bacterium]|nr:methyltransferase domain-containing protein [Candidatus Eremiobacteraceae bacterium]
MKPTKDEVARQFDRMSTAYARSVGHAGGDDLDILVRFVAPTSDMRVLDVATGTGNTAAAIAPSVASVIAIDIAPSMLERTRELAARKGLTNLTTALMDAEALDFDDAFFDVVTSRIAPHHFIDIARAIREIARVLRPDGAFVVEDSIVPDERELDTFLNDVERLRDPTHVRSLTAREWTDLLASAGLTQTKSSVCRKPHPFAEWIARAGMEEADAERVYAAFAAAPPGAVECFDIVYEGGRPLSFTDDKLIIRAEKSSRPTL